MVVYGIRNCDTVKRAVAWLNERGVSYEFYDFKKQGVTEELLERWALKLGWETLINKRGTTWKKQAEELRNSVTTPEAAFKLLKDNPSMIRRPVLEDEDILIFGFDEKVYSEKLI